MKIEKYRDGKRILNRVLNKDDIHLFSHCSNGSYSVSTKFLNEHVIPMLFVHGVIKVEVVDNTKTFA